MIAPSCSLSLILSGTTNTRRLRALAGFAAEVMVVNHQTRRGAS